MLEQFVHTYIHTAVILLYNLFLVIILNGWKDRSHVFIKDFAISLPHSLLIERIAMVI